MQVELPRTAIERLGVAKWWPRAAGLFVAIQRANQSGEGSTRCTLFSSLALRVSMTTPKGFHGDDGPSRTQRSHRRRSSRHAQAHPQAQKTGLVDLSDFGTARPPRWHRRLLRHLVFPRQFGAWAEIAAARARGEPVWFAELEPEGFSSGEDATPLLLEATKVVQWTASWQHAKVDRADSIALFGDETGNRKPNAPQLKEAAEANVRALELLRQALQKSQCHLVMDYQSPRSLDAYAVGHQQYPGSFRFILRSEFHVALIEGDANRAMGVIEDTCDLAELFREQKIEFSQRFRAGTAICALKQLEMLLSHFGLTNHQFSRLDARLEAMSSFRLRDGVLGERAIWMTAAENLGENANVEGVTDGFHSERFLHPLAMEQQAILLRQYGEVAAIIDKPGATSRGVVDALEAELAHSPSRYKLLLDMNFYNKPKALRQMGLGYRQLLSNARLGMRVERYYRQHGKLPGSLSEVLDGDFMVLPTCLFSEKPLIFRPQPSGGFVIYGPGDNGVDDGADRARDEQEGIYAFRVLYNPRASQ